MIKYDYRLASSEPVSLLNVYIKCSKPGVNLGLIVMVCVAKVCPLVKEYHPPTSGSFFFCIGSKFTQKRNV